MTMTDLDRLVLIDYYWQLSIVDDAYKVRLVELVQSAGYPDWTAVEDALEPIRRKKRIAIELLKSRKRRQGRLGPANN